MRKNEAERNYISGIKKLSARANPFADEVDAGAAEAVCGPAPRLRRRYGWAAAAAVLIVCIAAGAFLVRGELRRDEPSTAVGRSAAESDGSEAAEGREPSLKYSYISDAAAGYRSADKETFALLRTLDSAVWNSEEAYEALRSEMHALFLTQQQTREDALAYLDKVDAAIVLLDAVSYEGDGGCWLRIYNGLDTELRLTGSGTAYSSGTGKKYAEFSLDGSCTAAPDSVCEVRMTSEQSLHEELSLFFEEAKGLTVALHFNAAEAIAALPRERTQELLAELERP